MLALYVNALNYGSVKIIDDVRIKSPLDCHDQN